MYTRLNHQILLESIGPAGDKQVAVIQCIQQLENTSKCSLRVSLKQVNKRLSPIVVKFVHRSRAQLNPNLFDPSFKEKEILQEVLKSI